MGMQSGTATLEKDWAVSYTVKHTLHNPAMPLQVIYPKEMKTAAKILYANVHSSKFSHIHQSLKTIQMSTGEWLNKV